VLKMSASRRSIEGFSLVELMVAMAAGLVLVGSVLALLASSARANAITIQSTKLSQELRALSGVVVGEVRRARYNPAALSNIGLGNAALNPYDEVRIEGGGTCLRFSYERADGQHARTFAYRADANGVGTVFFATGADPAGVCRGCHPAEFTAGRYHSGALHGSAGRPGRLGVPGTAGRWRQPSSDAYGAGFRPYRIQAAHTIRTRCPSEETT
jgi:hypothetical protein